MEGAIMKRKVLFIGGPFDGKRKTVDDELEVVEVDDLPDWKIDDYLNFEKEVAESFHGPTCRRYLYVKERLQGEEGVWEMYRWRGLSADDMISRLLANYGGQNG
jgi:hypothetical protein